MLMMIMVKGSIRLAFGKTEEKAASISGAVKVLSDETQQDWTRLGVLECQIVPLWATCLSHKELAPSHKNRGPRHALEAA